jgi:ribonuclease P protein component
VNKDFRLTRSADFQRVREHGKSYAHPLLVLIALPVAEPGTRFGIVTGRSLGSAVRRNRIKRLLRSALQPYLVAINSGWIVVLIARRPMAEASFSQTQAALLALLRRAHLLQEAHEQRIH